MSGPDTRFAHIPPVSQVDAYLKERGLPHGRAARPQVEAALRAAREEAAQSPPQAGVPASRQALLESIAATLQKPHPQSLRRVINATGVVIHTNLGRSVLPRHLSLEGAFHYTNLEFDLRTGRRGSRGGRVPQLLAQLAGGQAGLAVNNNAAAVLLLLASLGQGGEVVVSRGELVEIGGAFRVPDIMAQSGVRLVEVGTTNRTRLEDYQRAVTPLTRGFLKVHRSNFYMDGFVQETSVAQLAGLAAQLNPQRQAAGLPAVGVWHDLGSGNFYRFKQPVLAGLPNVRQALEEGADLVTFSGDKLLGSVQAGLVAGQAAAVEQMGAHPLYRSLRMDKVRLLLLEQMLEDCLNPAALPERNPAIAMLEATPQQLAPLAAAVLARLAPHQELLSVELVEGSSKTGGGAAPELDIPTLCLAVTHPHYKAEALAEALRQRPVPVIGRIENEKLLLDLRTLLPEDEEELALALAQLGLLPPATAPEEG